MHARHRWPGLLLALVLAAAFAWLGFWQLDRLAERRGANTVRAAALARTPLDLGPAGTDTRVAADSVLWRRVRVAGSWDPAHEVVVRGRAFLGSPGVEVLTPLRRGEAAVLVRRGWLPAADGLSADLEAARSLLDPGPVTVEGLALPGETAGPIAPRILSYASGPHLVLGSADVEAAGRMLPYEVAPFILQILPEPVRPSMAARRASSNAPRMGRPVPLPPPPLTDGPHLLYAFQWFGFAAIAVAGAALLPRAARGRRVPIRAAGGEVAEDGGARRPPAKSATGRSEDA